MRIELYQGESGKWFWRLRCMANRKIVADGSQGYSDVSGVRRAVRRLFNVLCNGPVRVVVVKE